MGYSDYKLPANNAKKNELQQKLARLAGINPRAPNLGSRVSNTTFSSPEYNRLKSEFVRVRTFQEAWIPTIKAGGFSRFTPYDLKTDPQQKKDISKQRPKVTERLKKELLVLYENIMADAPDWSAQTGTENIQGQAKQNPEKGQRVQSSPLSVHCVNSSLGPGFSHSITDRNCRRKLSRNPIMFTFYLAMCGPGLLYGNVSLMAFFDRVIPPSL